MKKKERISSSEKKSVSESSQKISFRKQRKLYKNRSFRKQYDLFRKSGLGRIDSFFNAFYILLTEKSVEKEKEKRGEKCQEQDRFLDLHTPLLRIISYFPRKIGAFSARVLSFGERDASDGIFQIAFRFLRKYAIPLGLFALALFVSGIVIWQLSCPIVLRASIDGKVIGVVESKNTVDSAKGELEDNVEFILGESFHFPYEIEYRFSREWKTSITPKKRVSENLYSYVSEFICTATGLYVDDVLVAVCEEEDTVNRALEDFVNANATGEEAGILNEIMVITQAYPTDSIIGYDELRLLLKEMAVPLDKRKKEPVPGDSVLAPQNPLPEDEVGIPAMALVSDTHYVPEEKEVSRSNRPMPINNIKLEVYTSNVIRYETVLPYETEYVESKDHYTTMADVTTRGKNGSAEIEARVFYVDGKEVKREIIYQNVLVEPITRVVSIGTKVLPEELGFFSFDQSPKRFIIPRIGYVSHYYGPRDGTMHSAWDIPGHEGDNIYAAASGTVVVAIGQNGHFSNTPSHYYTGYGYCVVIRHDDGYSTMYAHCNRINVTLGQEVKQGEKIAEVGNTGNSDGNHLHFEVIKGGRKLDPALYFYEGTKTIYD